jgi:methionyl-tRNA formyltransferase
LGAELLLNTVARIEQGKITPQPQDESGVSYAPRLKKTDGLIDWTQAASIIERRIRGLNPWPGAYTFLKGKRLKLLTAEVSQRPPDTAAKPGQIIKARPHQGFMIATGQRALIVRQLQPENRAVMQADQFLAGLRESLVDKFFSSQP